MKNRLLIPIVLGLASVSAGGAALSFNRDIRPILSDKCFACHGTDVRTREADLRLDVAEAAYENRKNGAAWVPGSPDASLAWERILSTDPDEIMPPPESHKELTGKEKSLIQLWIKEGAKYEPHWAYVPIKKMAPPAKGHPIDAFVRRRLAADGLKPAPRASRSDLIRRLSYDLTGLPPSPEAVAAFVADKRPDAEAVEALLARLLASPHFGERMAVPWLDLVRFADTVGYHGDQNQRIFPYRDYVIQSFNSNKPYDAFVREQLAGDLLPNPTDDQLIGTGFLRLNMMTREGGAQPEEYMAKYAADRVRAVGTVFMGQTTGCAECHDHKFDPITAKDFYALAAFFDDLRQWGVYTSYGYTPNPDLGGWNNESPFPPEVLAPNAARHLEIRELLPALRVEAAGKRDFLDAVANDSGFTAWRQQVATLLQGHADGWIPLAPGTVGAAKATPHAVGEDASVSFSGPPKKGEVLTLSFPVNETLPTRTLRLEALPGLDGTPTVGRAGDGRFRMKVSWRILRAGAAKPEPLAVAWAQADRREAHRYRNGKEQATLEAEWRSGPHRWGLPADANHRAHTATFHLKSALTLQAGDQLEAVVASDDVARLRVSVTPFSDVPPGWSAVPENAKDLFKLPLVTCADSARAAEMFGAWRLAVVSVDKVSGEVKRLRSRVIEARAGMAYSLAASTFPQERHRKTRILPRGNWQDTSGEEVSPAVPEFLPQPTTASTERELTRLDLANWLVSEQNPLTARHFVNRTWKLFFGTGLSARLDDLGNQGEPPSHPDLLDWLADDFRSNGWDVKRLVRQIVTSHTYQQEAATRDDLQELDPYNRLLAQQSARRLDAEFIRDHALEVAGILYRPYVGGPSVFPYQPPGYYAPLNFPARKYPVQTDERRLRRGVYMHWQRTFLHPMLVNFDAPGREECTGERLLSNSPQQALTLLNDPVFVEAAKALARRLEQELPDGTLDQHINRAFTLALSREASPEERASLTTFYAAQRKHFADTPADATGWGGSPEHAALGQVCRVILNLHEGITRY